jgi:hypothetical protein
MRRRTFIAGLGSAAAWPLAALLVGVVCLGTISAAAQPPALWPSATDMGRLDGILRGRVSR